MLCSVADSEAKLLPSGMNEDSHSPSCSYPGGSRRAPPRSVLRQRPLGNFLQRRAPAARDAFPETEIMFPLLPDSRMDAWSGGYPLDSPPDSLRRRSANGRTQGPSSARTGSSAARNRTSHDGGSRQGSQRRHAARDAGARRSVSSGFFKRIFRGTPRKYSRLVGSATPQLPPEPKDTPPELSFSEVMMRYHQQSPDSGNSFGSATKKSASERKTMPEVVPAAPPPAQRKKRFTAHERKMVYVKILQDALSNQDACPNSALMVTPDVESGWFLVSFHVWVRHDHQPLKDAVAAKRFPKSGATYFVHGGTGTL
ncbi:uncharacterized protein [Dermacentor andersoni]|uniref:uncharacterized protein isoform X1 n=1 Tax=Dermacentor andersoni TaxID=34620 RepID=UPI002415E86C|nr:uncharacterized protein LOC126522837 isoform X1 [Dermacentor andersoni]